MIAPHSGPIELLLSICAPMLSLCVPATHLDSCVCYCKFVMQQLSVITFTLFNRDMLYSCALVRQICMYGLCLRRCSSRFHAPPIYFFETVWTHFTPTQEMLSETMAAAVYMNGRPCSGPQVAPTFWYYATLLFTAAFDLPCPVRVDSIITIVSGVITAIINSMNPKASCRSYHRFPMGTYRYKH